MIRIVTGLFLFALGALAVHLSYGGNIQTPPPVTQPASLMASVTSSDNTDDPLNQLTIEEKVGQLFILGHWTDDYYQHTERLLSLYGFGGVIIMSTPDETVDSIPTWTNAWQEASPIPLIVSIDQEGGVVTRIKKEGYLQTSQREITTPTGAHETGKTRGNELAALGINVNLAPVLDYASDTDAFLYDRSFPDVEQIDTMALELIRGHQEAGVLAVPKHFPGHANNPDDSHFILPVVAITAAQFSKHVETFRPVVTDPSVQALMTAHVQFPKLDDEYPSTLSYEILSRQLRRDIGFDGVIITDDMTMAAITDHHNSAEAAVLALQAGADMILYAAKPNEAIKARQYVLDAVTDGTLTEERINESVRRILKLKESL